MKHGPNGSRPLTKAPRIKIESSSGNVFSDLALPAADEDLARAKLAQRIAQIIASRRLTQSRAAAILEIDQPKVSALVRGKLEGFSTDRLLRFLNALGQDVQIVVRDRGTRRALARTRMIVSAM